MEPFFTYLRKYISVNEELEQRLTVYAEIHAFKKNASLLREGQITHSMYFLQEGIARVYYHYKEKEITSWIYNENNFFTSWNSFINQSPTNEYIQLLSSSKIISFSHDKLEKIYAEFPEFESFARKHAQLQIAVMDEYFKGFLFFSAKERYQLLLDYFPDITLRVSLGHIASYLGISQETLSRIRSQEKK